MSEVLFKKYVILSRVKLLKPSVGEFLKMCSDLGIDPMALLSEVEVVNGRVKLTWDGEKLLSVVGVMLSEVRGNKHA